MKKILFLFFSMLPMTVAAQNEFAGSKWIGDICNLQTPIPEGRHYSGGDNFLYLLKIKHTPDYYIHKK